MSYICPECGSILNKKSTNKEIIRNAIHIDGIEVNELYEMFGHMFSIATIDIILNKLVQEYDCYIPEKGRIASCYGEDAVRHVFPK